MLLILLGLAQTLQAETGNNVKKKEINQSYPISKNGLLSVENRFGDIIITHSDKAEASIHVVIESSASSDQEAQTNLDRIKIDLRKDGDKVSAVTTISKSTQSNSQNQQFKINYHISIPASLNLELNQRYGNINLPAKNEGESKLTIKYGNINAGSFTKTLNLDAGYSNLNIRDVTNATVSLAYCGGVMIGSSKQLDIESKYSNVTLDDTDRLNISIKYGNLTMKKARSVSLEVKYSNAKINNISEELLLESLSYSTLIINELSPNFKRLNASAHYGTLDIGIDPKAAFRIDATRAADKLVINGLKETKHNVENKTDHYVEINGGGSGVIRFEGNKYSTLKVNAK